MGNCHNCNNRINRKTELIVLLILFMVLSVNCSSCRIQKKQQKVLSQFDLTFSSYIGDSQLNTIVDITLDDQNNIYIIGNTTSKTFPLLLPDLKLFLGYQEAIVIKLNESKQLLWSGFIGESSINNFAQKISILPNGQILALGQSKNTKTSESESLGEYSFVVLLDQDGHVIKRKNFQRDEFTDIDDFCCTPSNIYLIGSSYHGIQVSDSSINEIQLEEMDQKVFVLKCDYNLNESLIYEAKSYFLNNVAITIDKDENLYFIENSVLMNNKIKIKEQLVCLSNKHSVKWKKDVFNDVPNDTIILLDKPQIEVDGSGRIVLAGTSEAQDVSIALAFSQTGEREWESIIGFSKTTIRKMKINQYDYLFMTGMTTDPEFTVINPYQSKMSGYSDAFVSVLDCKTGDVILSTFFGSSKDDYLSIEGAGSLTFTAGGKLLISGLTTSNTDFPLKNAVQTSFVGSQSPFIAEFDLIYLLESKADHKNKE